MKKLLINYYDFIMIGLFILFNIILNNIKFDGILYVFIMLLVIILNIVFNIKNAKLIKHKGVALLIYFLIILLSNSVYNLIFAFTSIIILSFIGFKESLFNKIVSVIVLGLIIVFLPLLSLGLMFTYGSGKQTELDDIYEDMHYYCENNYEVYTYSAGAMDRFHYSIGKHYEIININKIIYVAYKDRNEVSKKKYDNYLKKHKCNLVNSKNKS